MSVLLDPTVFVVDDDEAVRKSLQWLVESVGLKAETFASVRAFLEVFDPGRPGCVVLDVRMPGMSGTEALARLAELGSTTPVIVVTAYGDVPTAVRTLKEGAVDFIEKPCSHQLLLERIQQCVEADAENRRTQERCENERSRLATLTERERDVLDRVVMGRSNRQIAEELGLSPKTVEAHRTKVMQKTKARTLADLVRMALSARKTENKP